MPDNDLSPTLGTDTGLAPALGKNEPVELYRGFTPPPTDDPRWALSPWTKFNDMHSGGNTKLDAQVIYIQAPEAEAKIIFQNRFGFSPNRVSCTCCGSDYSIWERGDLYEATGIDRNCLFDAALERYIEEQDPEQLPKATRYRSSNPEAYNYTPLADYLKSEISTILGTPGDQCKLVYADEVSQEERQGELRRSGYIWVD